MPFAQTLAQLCQQGVVRGTGQVIHLDQPGALFAACGAHGDEWGFFGPRPSCHGGFCRHLVAGVNHGIYRRRQHCGPVVRFHEGVNGVHPAVRMKPGNARLHGQHLGLAERGVGGVYLTVDVGFGYVVQVDQRDLPDAAARQRFCGPGSHATDACYGHMRAGNRISARRAVQAQDAAKAPGRMNGKR